jgi:hypothetical protein
MARDGAFFHAMGRVHPRYRTPAISLIAIGAWSIVLALSGSYDQLYTYVMFMMVLSYVAGVAALFVLRRKRPDVARPYLCTGYPYLPALYLLMAGAWALNSVVPRPKEPLIGIPIASGRAVLCLLALATQATSKGAGGFPVDTPTCESIWNQWFTRIPAQIREGRQVTTKVLMSKSLIGLAAPPGETMPHHGAGTADGSDNSTQWRQEKSWGQLNFVTCFPKMGEHWHPWACGTGLTYERWEAEMRRIAVACLSLVVLVAGLQAQALTGGGQESSSRTQPDAAPTPPGAPAPDLGTQTSPPPQSNAKKVVNKLDPHCIDVIFHACWSSPATPPGKVLTEEEKKAKQAAEDIEVGYFYMNKKNFLAAESRLQEASELKPDAPAAWVGLAQAQQKLGKDDAARQSYEEYLKLNPDGAGAEQAKKAMASLQTAAH